MKGLFEITPSGEDGLFEVRLNPDHAVFSGHFPGKPILPGVCSLMIVRECASSLAGRPLRYTSIKESKFLSAVTPSEAPVVKLRLMTDGETYTADATISAAETIKLKLKAILTTDE